MTISLSFLILLFAAAEPIQQTDDSSLLLSRSCDKYSSDFGRVCPSFLKIENERPLVITSDNFNGDVTVQEISETTIRPLGKLVRPSDVDAIFRWWSSFVIDNTPYFATFVNQLSHKDGSAKIRVFTMSLESGYLSEVASFNVPLPKDKYKGFGSTETFCVKDVVPVGNATYMALGTYYEIHWRPLGFLSGEHPVFNKVFSVLLNSRTGLYPKFVAEEGRFSILSMNFECDLTNRMIYAAWVHDPSRVGVKTKFAQTVCYSKSIVDGTWTSPTNVFTSEKSLNDQIRTIQNLQNKNEQYIIFSTEDNKLYVWRSEGREWKQASVLENIPWSRSVTRRDYWKDFKATITNDGMLCLCLATNDGILLRIFYDGLWECASLLFRPPSGPSLADFKITNDGIADILYINKQSGDLTCYYRRVCLPNS